MRITLERLRRIIREELQTSQTGDYKFVGDLDAFEDGDLEEMAKEFKKKGLKAGKIKVKKEKDGSITLDAPGGRKFNINIKDIPDSPEGGGKPDQQKSGGNSQQNSGGNVSGQKPGVKPQGSGQKKV